MDDLYDYARPVRRSESSIGPSRDMSRGRPRRRKTSYGEELPQSWRESYQTG